MWRLRRLGRLEVRRPRFTPLTNPEARNNLSSVGLDSFDEALDADTVLWAVRGMNATRLGVSAQDVAEFLSKDTTLSSQYERDDVGVLLDSLTADGMLTYEPTTGEFAAIDASGLTSADIDAAADGGGVGVGARPASMPGEGVADAFLRLRVEALERER